jgi:hypothetical protein
VIGLLLGKPGPAETLTHRRSRTGTGNSWHSPRACSSRLGKLTPKFRPVIFRHGTGVRCPLGDRTNMARNGEAAMTVVLNELLLFSCLAAFVTGIVIAAATLLI